MTSVSPVVFLACAVLFLGCGTSADDARSLDPTPQLVQVDKYGCPTVEPTPWSETIDYESFCGEGCVPVEAASVDTLNAPDLVTRDDAWLVACVSEDIVVPPALGDPAGTCVVSPMDDQAYSTVTGLGYALSVGLCWERCSGTGDPPPGC